MRVQNTKFDHAVSRHNPNILYHPGQGKCFLTIKWIFEFKTPFSSGSMFRKIASLGSDALSGKMLLVKIVEYYIIDAYFRAG